MYRAVIVGAGAESRLEESSEAGSSSRQSRCPPRR